jgi:tetratricopeptide (TPR) repeat protein
VTVGSDALSVSTKLRAGDHPTIETLVSNQGRVVFRTAVPIEDLKPIFAHSQEILRRVEVQHSTILGEIQERGLDQPPMPAVPAAASPVPAAEVPELALRLERALTYLGKKDFGLAERELREVFDRDPDFTEARELLDIVQASRSQTAPPVTSISDRLRAGAEALTRGWKSSAIQNWARGLSADPSNRIFQFLVLLTTTPSAERRRGYLQELFAMGQDLLGGDRSEEAHALLLALQAIEDPKGVSPQLSGESVGPALGSDPATAAHLRPTDTQPTLIETPPEVPETDGFDEAAPAPSPTDGNRRDDDFLVETEHPDREAALAEARQAEVEASRQDPAPPFRARAYFGSGSIPNRIVAHPRLVLAGAAVLLLVAGLVALLPAPEENSDAGLEGAAALLGDGEIDRAIVAYTRILDSGQFQAQAYLGRGRANLAAGETETGLADLSRAAELEPDSPEIAEEMADGLFTRDRFDDAAESYSRAISIGGDNAKVRYRLAASLVQLGRADEAGPELEAALRLDPSHGEARFLYAKLLNAEGRYAEAEQEIRGARLRFDPGAEYFIELGLAHLQQVELDEAEELARKLERYDPSDARSHTLLGEVYLARKRFEAARQELITALQTNADQPRARLALGRVWLAIGRARGDAGDLAKARQILEEAKGIPEGERLMTLGELSRAEGDSFNAINFLEKALAHGGKRLPVRLALAEARFAAGDLAGVAQELHSADILDPYDAAIALSLGLVHSRLKDFPEASKEYLKAIHRVGLTKPVEENSGPVVLPLPYVGVPARFNVNRAIRDAYRRTLAADEENEIATALKDIAQSTSFVIAGPT